SACGSAWKGRHVTGDDRPDTRLPVLLDATVAGRIAAMAVPEVPARVLADGLAVIRRALGERPAAWATVEASSTEVAAVLRATTGAVLVDSLGAWVAGAPDLAVDTQELCGALRSRDGDSVVVTDEVGLGVHPSSELARRFRDVLGEVNQAVARVADEVLLVVAGRVLPLSDLMRS
ncbi:MAG: bifunctional adenosylcobinamide kinase/adenosylcobinamide-phosphate guanylyltransferase, partial [Actinobacteria bacterium]|nr:bifunctional adenosylcobinamide kinase/adenosylcobinamide-phosphate guanylyltransferase [Actinomycetota bacterium]